MVRDNKKDRRGGKEEKKGQEDQEEREDKKRDEEKISANQIPEWELDFSEEKVKEATKRIKRNKTPGENKLILKFFRELPNEIHKEWLSVLNNIWRKGTTPRSWKRAIIYPIYKASDEDWTENYFITKYRV